MIGWIAVFLTWLALIFILVELAGSPRLFICDCQASLHHLRASLLLLVGLSDTASPILWTIENGFDVASLALNIVGAAFLWRWWRHTKNQRKKLKDKALGVVRETAAGLKVVPIPGGAA